MRSVKRVKKKTDKVRERVDIRSYNLVTLIDGAKEVQPKSNYVYSKDGFDNVQLNGGFTTSFWIYIDKMGANQEASILYQWRNISEYDFRVGYKKQGIYLEVKNQADEVERILSEKKLLPRTWYNVIVRFEFENEDICDASLFINSYFDASGSISNYYPFNYVSVSVGRFKKIKSFHGAIAELFVFFYPMTKAEIEEHYKDGLHELENGDGQFLRKVLEKDEADHNRRMFATEKHVPDEVLKQVDVQPTFFKSVSEEPTSSELNDRIPGEDAMTQTGIAGDEAEVMQNLDLYIFEHPLLADDITQIANNYEWILTVSSVIVSGDITKEGAIELSRFMKILKFSKISLTKSSVWEIAEVTKTSTEIIDEYDDQVKHKGILYYYFLKIIKEVVYADMISNLADEDVERVSVGHFSDSDDHIEEPEEEAEEEEKEEEPEEKPVAVNMRKDSFHSSPEKFQKVPKMNEGEGEGEQEEAEGDKTLPPVRDEDQVSIPPAATANYEPSLNEEGLIKHEHDEELQQEKEEPVEEPPVEEEPAVEEEEDNSLPELDDDWNSGEFELNIIRCSECHKHYDYCRHSEDEYVNAFNEIGNEISEKFPEVNIIGNHEKGNYLGCFDIYLRGVGPVQKRDGQGRYFIFRKNQAGRMPKGKDITDTLTILSLLYGNAGKLGMAQKDFKRTYSYLIPRPNPGMHEYPAETPATVKKQPDIKKNVKQGGDRIMVCKNWGCGKEYNEEKNEKYSCQHHPGVYQFGSRHGLWPESWTCCRAEWDTPGCRKGFHKGVPKEEFTRLCINHGEPNPDSIYPDSFCGKPFKEPERKPEWQQTQEDKDALLQCRIHPGYLKIDKKSDFAEWTCCNESADADPCAVMEHRHADFPEEEAKKYFYDKPLKPIGNYNQQNQYANEFELYGRFCGIFREAKPYVEKNPPQKLHISRDEQKKLDQLDKVCLHWACGKVFKEAENYKRSCRCHTGKWDFGNSVRSCRNTATDELMWEPHWTCCRRGWDDPGCKRMPHKGVYLETYEEIKPKYVWPDPNAQIYFKKNISPLWRQKMMQQ